MTTIESKHVQISKPKNEVVAYVSDMRNFEKLLPKERISDFQSDGQSCSFKIQGMATIGLKVEEVLEDKIKLVSTDSPFKFDIDIILDENDSSTKAFQIVNLDLNPMMKMMVEKPLRNLFDHIATRLEAELG